MDYAERNPDYYICCADVYYSMGEKGIRFLKETLCESAAPNEQAGLLSDLSSYYEKYNLGLEQAARFLENAFSREE